MTTDSQTIEKKKTSVRKPKEPGKFNVIIYNDDVTPVEFVVAMLVRVFRHPEAAAIDLTIKVHNEGSAVAGTYSHEIAEQKTTDGTQMARANDFPLVIKMEAE
jgi:ATP-dependent Clp protease adaptor protein ClpS